MILNDTGYLGVFNENIIPKDNVLIIAYKIYFQLIKAERIISLFEDTNEFKQRVNILIVKKIKIQVN